MDNVQKPKHYEGRNGMQAIEIVRNFATVEQEKGFYLGNVIKYTTRYQNKNGVEDLKKAKKNLEWLIDLEERNRK